MKVPLGSFSNIRTGDCIVTFSRREIYRLKVMITTFLLAYLHDGDIGVCEILSFFLFHYRWSFFVNLRPYFQHLLFLIIPLFPLTFSFLLFVKVVSYLYAISTFNYIIMLSCRTIVIKGLECYLNAA